MDLQVSGGRAATIGGRRAPRKRTQAERRSVLPLLLGRPDQDLVDRHLPGPGDDVPDGVGDILSLEELDVATAAPLPPVSAQSLRQFHLMRP